MAALGSPDRKTITDRAVPLETEPQLSIIIVNHRTGHILDACLASIAEGDHDLATEVIIVDNPPETAPSNLIPDTLRVKRPATKMRVGFSEAANMGAAAAKGTYLLFLNPDVVMDKSAIRNLLAVWQTTPDAGVVTGKLTNADGAVQPSCRRFPTIGRLFVSRGSIASRFSGRYGKKYLLPEYQTVTAVDWCAAAMILTTRKIFQKVGGFDPGFYLYLEDTDLCYRLAQIGCRTYYVPEAQAVHLWGASTAHYRFRRIIWHHASVWRYFRKHHRAPLVLTLLFPLLVGNALLSLTLELFTFQR